MPILTHFPLSSSSFPLSFSKKENALAILLVRLLLLSLISFRPQNPFSYKNKKKPPFRGDTERATFRSIVRDEPEFKFIHYSGRTSQNTYEGAFVYAREPTLPPAAKKSVYRIAKEAGMVPANFCAVRNDLATCGVDAPAADDAPVPEEARARKGLFMPGAASASEVDETGLASDRKPDPVLPKWVRTVGEEVASYLEDPHATERWVFAQQQKMGPGDD